jgi:hypothetical protein
MRLAKIIDGLNTWEKTPFIKILDSLADASEKKHALESIITDSAGADLKSVEGDAVAAIYTLLEDEFVAHLEEAFGETSNQFDLLADVLSRDGNAIMSMEWFAQLYEEQLGEIDNEVGAMKEALATGKSSLAPERLKEYRIYQACLETAYNNDIANNSDPKVTADEMSILMTLSKQLHLSSHEVNLINYTVIPCNRRDTMDTVDYLRKLGVLFHQKKTGKLFVADEVVRAMRKVRGREVADKFFRRMLGLLKDAEVNQLCKYHGIPLRGIERDVKVIKLINDGVSFLEAFSEGIYKEDAPVNDRKKRLNEICALGLPDASLSGSTMEAKVESIIAHFDEVDRDDRIGIAMEGFDQLLRDLESQIPSTQHRIKEVFQLQEDGVMNAEFLVQFNIKPRDVLEILEPKDLSAFIKENGIKTRGMDVLNVLSAYKDTQNLFYENYTALASRDLNSLKEVGIRVKESELGVKFEEVTKAMFEDLGFKVDEALRKQVNTKRDKIDILVSLDDGQVLLVECKTAKESNYNKFSAITRQLNAYRSLLASKEVQVAKCLIVAPDFSEDFVADAEMDYELAPSLLTASSFYAIHSAFKGQSKHKSMPQKLFSHARDVLIDADRVVKAMSR